MQALHESSSSEAWNVVEQSWLWQPLMALSKTSRCPAVAAECIEIARLFLRSLSTAGNAPGRKGEAAQAFAAGFKAACREVLVAATSGQVARTGEEAGALGKLKQLALRPVLIESCVSGLLEAAAALQKRQISQPSGGFSTSECGAPEMGGDGLQVEDVELLLASSDEDVNNACRATMLAMVTNGTFPARLHSGRWQLLPSQVLGLWFLPILRQSLMPEL